MKMRQYFDITIILFLAMWGKQSVICSIFPVGLSLQNTVPENANKKCVDLPRSGKVDEVGWPGVWQAVLTFILIS